MKKNKFIYIALCSIGFIACEPEFDQPLEDTPIPAQEKGNADFSKFVSIGNSLTAGFSDGALFREGQENAFPNILAQQMAPAGGGTFNTPFMTDNIGGFRGAEADFGTRFVLEIDSEGNRAPVRFSETASNDITAKVSGPFNNFGVPGAKSYHLGSNQYASANPYYGRFASAQDATIIGDVAATQPTFFTMWIGNNDALSYATAGGGIVTERDGTTEREAVFQSMETNPALYSEGDLSNPLVVAGAIKNYTDLLTAAGTNDTKGVVINIPEIPSIPFFTTVPNNALVLNETQAAGLTGFFQLYTNILKLGAQPIVEKEVMDAVAKAVADALAAGATAEQIPAIQAAATEQASAIAATKIAALDQYAVKFNPGPNRFLIRTSVTAENPQGFRQMSSDELLLLTIDQNALKTAGYGSANISDEITAILTNIAENGPSAFNPADAPKILKALNPILDGDVLDQAELTELSTAITGFNAGIKSIVDANPNLVLLNANKLLKELASTSGVTSEGTTVTATFGTGGAFSLDGIHLTPRGNAILANELIKVINSNFKSTLQPVDPNNFKTITLK